jgi:Tfp pilus assembly protein PilV
MMNRRGMMMLEAMVAGVLLGTLLVVCLQMLSAAVVQRRAADQRQCAVLELSNVMERIAARPWANLTTAVVAQEKLSPSADGQLPGAELKIEVSTDAKDPNAKRITATLRWHDRSGQLGAPMTLSTWRYNVERNSFRSAG